MRCERCGGPLWRDEDGDASCLTCGRPVYRVKPLDATATRGSGLVLRNGRRTGGVRL